MTIHVVTEGESLESIANQYGLSEEFIQDQNELPNPDNLVPGQTIVIQYPAQTYTVQENDNLIDIAEANGITVVALLQNNPGLNNRDYIYPGETLVISFQEEKLGAANLNGYAYPFINRRTLQKTLPYLTFLTIFTYGFTPEGELIPIDDTELINIARDYGVAPIMLLSTLTNDGTFSNALAHSLLINEDVQNTLIQNILTNMKEKNYYGLDVDFEFIYPEDKDLYVDFINKLRIELNENDFEVMVALAPKIADDQPGTLYEGHDYAALGAAANTVLLMTYEWGYTFGPPMAVAPINKVREVLDYAITRIPPAKIYLGLPNYGYDWPLPFVRGTTQASSIGNVEAVERATQFGATIEYDETSQAPFYYYTNQDGVEHVVWFEDARSMNAKLRLIFEYGFRGGSYWNIMKFFPQNWLVANALYDIGKVL